MEEKIQSVDRVFAILESLKNYPNGVGLIQLSKDVGLHKSTVHRFLNTLILMDYVEQDIYNRYYLTFKLYDLISPKLEGLDIIKVSREFTKDLSDKVNEVIHLVIREGNSVVYIDKVDSDNVITMKSRIGRRIPLIYTSVGKAILSNFEDDVIKEIWDSTERTQKTENTILSFDEFLNEINSVRETGIAIDNEENEEGIYCVGTSIYNASGNVCGAISVTGPTFRMHEKIGDKFNEDLLYTARRISRNLGYRK